MTCYLDDHHVAKGARRTYRLGLPSQYAQYSDSFCKDIAQKLTKIRVQELYCEEMLAISRSGAYMGIWQIFQLASVLQRPINSVYPKKGWSAIRDDFNRTVYPVAETEDPTPLALMWKVCGFEKRKLWNPNHFVPLLPQVDRSHDVELEGPCAALMTGGATHIDVKQDTTPGVIQVDQEEPVTTHIDVKQDNTWCHPSGSENTCHNSH